MKIKKVIKYVVGIIVALVLSATIYVFAYSYTYNLPIFTTTKTTGVIGQALSDITNQPASTENVTVTADTQGITLDQLASYNGTNGQPAYVALKV